jgi:uncharacterized protein YcnI
MRLALALLFALLLAAPASAHVTVIPDVARPGDTSQFTFRVPNERADAATTALALFLPAGVPAEVAPHKGWTITNKGSGEIDFAARDEHTAILPGRTQDFKLTLGPLPHRDRLVFKALQTYADGQVVRWIETSGPDDEHPAAFLNLSGKGAGAKSSGSGGLYIGGAVLILVVAAAVVVTLRRRRVM